MPGTEQALTSLVARMRVNKARLGRRLHAAFKTPSPFYPHPSQCVYYKSDREKEREEESSLYEVSWGCIEVTVTQRKGRLIESEANFNTSGNCG